MRKRFETVDAYIVEFPPDAQAILQKIRKLIAAAAPRAAEMISYQIPAFKIDGKYLIYFAAFAKHVSVYPITPAMEETLGRDIAPYVKGKGTLQFSLAQPIPYDLIEQIIGVRLREMQARK